MDRHVLRDLEETVKKFIDEKFRSLKQQQVNKRNKHVLKSKVHCEGSPREFARWPRFAASLD